MLTTKINVGSITMTIESNTPLDQEVIQEIQNLNLPIYWNDIDSKHWSFDTKLNTGQWIENITFNNELTQGTALILN